MSTLVSICVGIWLWRLCVAWDRKPRRDVRPPPVSKPPVAARDINVCTRATKIR